MSKVRMDIVKFEEYTTKDGEVKQYPRRAGEVVEMDNGDGYFINIPSGMSLHGDDWRILPRQERDAA